MLVQLPILSSTLVTLSTWRWFVSPLCHHAAITRTSAKRTSAHLKLWCFGVHAQSGVLSAGAVDWELLILAMWTIFWPLQCTQHGGDDYDKIVKGDPGIESIYNWTSSGPTVGWRGATGKGDGVHVLTG